MLSLRRYVPAMLPDVLVLPMALVLSVALALPVALVLPTAAAQEPADGAADPNEPDASVTTRATADASPPLEDYEASEQISEDLSVSFPVDI